MKDQDHYNNMGFDLRTARTVQEVEAMRSPWESMQEHPLADIDYYLEIVLSRPEIIHPHVVLLSSNGQPRAMMVGIVEQKPFDLRIGYKTIYTPKPRSLTILDGGLMGEQTHAVADTFVSELKNTLKRGETDIVTLEVLRVDSDIYRLAKTKPSFFCRDRLSKSSRHWEMKVPPTIDEFFQQIEGSRTLRRKMRQFEKTYAGKVAFRSFNEKEQVDQFCRDAEEIAQYSYQRGLNVGFVFDDEHKRRLTQAAGRGWLRAYMQYVDDKPCAFWVFTLYKKTCLSNFLSYDTDYSRYSPGMVLFAKIMEEFCKDPKVDKVDFGSGDSIYKERFGDNHWQEANVMIFPPTFSGIRLNLIRTIILGFSQSLEYVVTRFGLLEKIKKIWRGKLRKDKT